MEQTLNLGGQRAVGVVWSLGSEGGKGSGAIPANAVGFHEDHEPMGRESWHELDPLSFQPAEEGVVDTVSLDTIDPDPTVGEPWIRQHSPAGKQDKSVLHQEGREVVARMKRDAPQLRTVETNRVEAFSRARARFIRDAVLPLEKDRVPGLGRGDGVERREIDGPATVERFVSDLPQFGAVSAHLPDVPGIPQASLAREQDVLAVEGDVGVARTREVARQARDAAIGLKDYERRALAIVGWQHSAG